MPAAGVALKHLREETRALHEALEDRVDAVQRLSVLADRQQLLSQYYEFHAVADDALGIWLADIPNLDLAARRRTEMIEADLRSLGLAPLSARTAPLALANTAQAMGLMYVMEGSSLGGKVILKALRSRGVDPAGLSFLDPYGEATGERWLSFCAVLEREAAGDPAYLNDAAAGARTGFRHAEACLCEPVG